MNRVKVTIADVDKLPDAIRLDAALNGSRIIHEMDAVSQAVRAFAMPLRDQVSKQQLREAAELAKQIANLLYPKDHEGPVTLRSVIAASMILDAVYAVAIQLGQQTVDVLMPGSDTPAAPRRKRKR